MNILSDRQFRIVVTAYIVCLIYLGDPSVAAFLLVLIVVFGGMWALIEGPDRRKSRTR